MISNSTASATVLVLEGAQCIQIRKLFEKGTQVQHEGLNVSTANLISGSKYRTSAPKNAGTARVYPCVARLDSIKHDIGYVEVLRRWADVMRCMEVSATRRLKVGKDIAQRELEKIYLGFSRAKCMREE